MLHPKNKTRFHSLNRIAKDIKVEKITNEGGAIWIHLTEEYNTTCADGIVALSIKASY